MLIWSLLNGCSEYEINPTGYESVNDKPDLATDTKNVDDGKDKNLLSCDVFVASLPGLDDALMASQDGSTTWEKMCPYYPRTESSAGSYDEECSTSYAEGFSGMREIGDAMITSAQFENGLCADIEFTVFAEASCENNAGILTRSSTLYISTREQEQSLGDDFIANGFSDDRAPFHNIRASYEEISVATDENNDPLWEPFSLSISAAEQDTSPLFENTNRVEIDAFDETQTFFTVNDLDPYEAPCDDCGYVLDPGIDEVQFKGEVMRSLLVEPITKTDWNELCETGGVTRNVGHVGKN